MNIVTAWLVFPAALALLSLGSGLLLERVAGRQLPGVLVLPAGFALVVCVAGLITSSTALAGLAFSVVAVTALAGYVLGASRLRRARPERWAAAAAVAVFLVFGAPAFLTGAPTFSGSLVLPDTSNQLVLGQRLSDAGPDHTSLHPSSYQVSASKYLSSQYPVAAQATLGALAPVGFQEMAWLYQPFLSFMAAMTALAVSGLIARWVGRPGLRAGVSFLAAQPALVYSYALQGSIKEIAAVASFWLMAALVGEAISNRAPARFFLPAVVASAAMIGVLGPAALAYLAPLVLALALPWGWRAIRSRAGSELGWAAVAVAVAVVFTLPILSGARTAYTVNSATLSLTQDLGNLAAPLKLSQAAGVWLARDFRYAADHPGLTRLLTGVVLAAGLLGLVWCVRRRAVGPLVAIVSLALVSAYLLRRGSPYADGKVLMVLSPAVMLAAGLGVALLVDLGPRLRAVGGLLAAVLAVAVLGSNAFAYDGVQNAPYHRYDELLDINQLFAGEGPALFTEYDEYAGYLLRRLDPYAAPEYPLQFRDKDPARTPNGLVDPDHRPSVKAALDIEDVTGRFVQSASLIVLRRSPTMSRPPANFDRVLAGRYYEVWRRQRGARALRVHSHLALGPDLFTAGGRAPCSAVRALARRARRVGGRLAYVDRPLLPVSNPRQGSRPRSWLVYRAYPRSVVPNGQGIVTDSVHIRRAGRYRVWFEGSFARNVEVEIDGRDIGGAAFEPGNAGQYVKVADLRLRPGRHPIRLVRGGGGLAPGDGGGARSSLVQMGPLVFSPPENEARRLRTVSPSGVDSLCGRRLDWIEVVSRGRRPGRS